MPEDKIMCNEAEVIKVVNTVMLPQIQELKYSIDGLAKNVQYVIGDAQKERDRLRVELAESQVEIKNLRKLMYGNGDSKPGLVAKVETLDNWVGDMRRFINVIIGALIVQIIGFMIVIGQHVLTGQ